MICNKCGFDRTIKRCKNCASIIWKRYYSTHREELLAKQKNYALTHPEQNKQKYRKFAKTEKAKLIRRRHRLKYTSQIRQYQKQYKTRPEAKARERELAQINRERIKANQQRYCLKHKEERAQKRQRKYRESEKERERLRQYRKSHPEVIRLAKANTRAKRRTVTGQVTGKQWKEILLFYGRACGKCKIPESERPLTVDHWIPIARGGDHNWKNVWPLCVNCNSSKWAHIPSEPYPPHVAIFEQKETA